MLRAPLSERFTLFENGCKEHRGAVPRRRILAAEVSLQ
jgi:hypothetical protein